MRAQLCWFSLFFAAPIRAHHSHSHIEVTIDPSLAPPAGSAYLWWVLGPVALLILLGLVRAYIRYRRSD
jgi:hypothetical protein